MDIHIGIYSECLNSYLDIGQWRPRLGLYSNCIIFISVLDIDIQQCSDNKMKRTFIVNPTNCAWTSKCAFWCTNLYMSMANVKCQTVLNLATKWVKMSHRLLQRRDLWVEPRGLERKVLFKRKTQSKKEHLAPRLHGNNCRLKCRNLWEH